MCKRDVRTQEALALEEGEVEAWVIRASGRKLLEARIDQLRGRVAVTRIPQRTFTADQWRQLTAQLGAWKVQPSHLCLPLAGPLYRMAGYRQQAACRSCRVDIVRVGKPMENLMA